MPEQLALFEKQDQIKNLDRVRSKLSKAILSWCEACLLFGPQFYMRELVNHLTESHKVSPDSPSRILRQLRREGRVKYTVVNRGQSLYRVEEVR